MKFFEGFRLLRPEVGKGQIDRMSKKVTIFLLIALFFASSGCQSTAALQTTPTASAETIVEAEPTEPATQTHTPAPTDTIIPTNTEMPTGTPTPTHTETRTPTPTLLPEGVELVTLKTPDGVDLVGYLHQPETPLDENLVVVLAHGHTQTHIEWASFEQLMIENGIATMTFDFRGHGASGGDDQFDTIGVDVKTVLETVRQKGFQRIICIGASMGGSACLAGAIGTDIQGLVMLSSEMNIAKLVSKKDIADLSIPKIFMFTEEDLWTGPGWSVEGFQQTAEYAAEPKEIYVYPGTAHGTGLFYDTMGEEVLSILLDFVKEIAE